jgi:Protein of unknown function (DUF4230)
VIPRPSRSALLALALLLGLGLTAVALVRTLGSAARAVAGGGTTSISHSLVVARMQAVSKLVTSETTIRDVVVYENTRLGSTKRSLVVVTGKAMVGVDLAQNAGIDIDAAAHRIAIRLPHARLLGLDIIDLRTYDERSGLWNRFRPTDRDTILQLARERLASAAREMAVRQHAEESARQLLTGLFASDGYSVDVQFEPFLAPPAAQ